MEIVEFLTARMDEDEAVARNAEDDAKGDANWLSDGSDEVVTEPSGNGVVTCCFTGTANGVAEHIARHDPARVLREVAAKRAILAEHKHAPATERSTDDFGCEICAYDRGDCVLYGWGWCKTVRLLAAPYADHPDYDESWRLDT